MSTEQIPEAGEHRPLLEISEWMEDALKANGAEVTGSGVFLGTPPERDVDFEYQGRRYNFTLHFLPETEPAEQTP